MTISVAGIDAHQDQFTVGIVDGNGGEVTTDTFMNTAAGFVDAIDMLTTHRVQIVGVEGSASWGAHIAMAVVAAGFDAREVPAQRSVSQRRARRLAKTDIIDSLSIARALLGEPTLGPVQTLEVYDPLVAKIEAVLEHRRALVETRTLMLHYAADQIAKLPTEMRDQLASNGKIESRLRPKRVNTGCHGMIPLMDGSPICRWCVGRESNQDRNGGCRVRGRSIRSSSGAKQTLSLHA